MNNLNPGSYQLANTDYDIAAPRADAMIHSLRAIGYDISTALADLVDNSISAGSKNIWIEFYWSGESSTIAVIDDGLGMSESTLLNAMRLGSRSPLEMRSDSDLGRFGLGLKTASFSQCKMLTVGSKTAEGQLNFRCWDLDYVQNCGEWRLLRHASDPFQQASARLNALQSGTVVFWENIDRLVEGTDTNSQGDQDLFLAQAANVARHLGMVFHRFIDRPNTLKIHINNQRAVAWDPFLSAESATQILTEEAHSIFGKTITVRPYVLPHHSKISEKLYRAAEGPAGWNAQQGFYVYRGQRLLSAGDWLNLQGIRKEEHFKLARILIDIPNSLDGEWEIDIKKSRATPPVRLRAHLLRIAKVTRQAASGIYSHRGTKLIVSGSDVIPMWGKKVSHGLISYHISRDHPLVKNLLSMGGVVRRKTEALLGIIEETVPVPMIMIDSAENPDKHAKPFAGRDESAITAVLRETYESLRQQGNSRNEALIILSSLDPFQHYPQLLASMPDFNDGAH